MLFLIWLAIFVVAATMMLLPLGLRLRELYKRYADGRLVQCPENKQSATVNIDALHAAETEMANGGADLRLCHCTRWPERALCNQACMSQALEAGPYTPGEGKVGSKPIYHLPILLAAFAAWVLGAVWHSRFLFRTEWMDSLRLTNPQVKQLMWSNSLHVLTIAVCFLFAYGVAMLLAVFHRKGILQGMLMSVLLCGAVVAASWWGIVRLPHALLAIEAGYLVLAAVIVGVIEGGLYNKLVLRSH
ncbi:MAG TPA: DUF1761 domain-containing protein [Terracidiphilus sp.]|nr:DUF1761 domain-containing protein [Terracidiphilus sp.]HUX28527.1 DUF1761 domain-containing protein [Terracidiphilus sp.]